MTEDELIAAIREAIASQPIDSGEPGTITTSEAVLALGMSYNKVLCALDSMVSNGMAVRGMVGRRNRWGISSRYPGYRFIRAAEHQ